ncbi:MAG: M28 family peptidase [Bacteroidota bacterium]
MNRLKLFLLLSFGLCTNQQLFSQDIPEKMLLNSLKVLSADSMEGRVFGGEGNRKAQAFMAQQFEKLGIAAAFEKGYIQTFTHKVPKNYLNAAHHDIGAKNTKGKLSLIGGNVIAKIEGSTQKAIVITAHIDHLGILKGEIYNGADDNASGTVALLAIADYFKKHPPKHQIILAAVDAEEIGSPGTKYLFKHLPIPKENIVLNLNMDMIAHSERQLYVCGTFHYPQLKKYLLEIETPIELLLGHDDPTDKEEEDWSNSSDHRIFHNAGIPFLYFGVEDHEDYHQPTDTYENINPDFFIEAVKVIIQVIENYDNSMP